VEKGTTASIALLYSSHWKNEDSARSYFEVFEQELPRQYDGLKRRQADEKDENERVYSTREGDVVLSRNDQTVWVSEGYDLVMARKLRDAVDAANAPMGKGPVMRAETVPEHDLVGGLVEAMGRFGVMKAGLPRTAVVRD
jgi:hypothetical protein